VIDPPVLHVVLFETDGLTVEGKASSSRDAIGERIRE
jgi:hypothetical protein